MYIFLKALLKTNSEINVSRLWRWRTVKFRNLTCTRLKEKKEELELNSYSNLYFLSVC